MTTVNQAIKHIRDREYMSGIERDKSRVNATAEIFTPTHTVIEVLDNLAADFSDPEELFLDNCCGDGQFLGEVVIRKMESGLSLEEALGSTFGVDLMPDNIELCKDRLLCGRDDLRPIVDNNIVQGDAQTYHYRFDGTPHGYKDRDELLAENAELRAEIERHVADKHKMHKKVGGYKTEIEKLRERVTELETKAGVIDEFFE